MTSPPAQDPLAALWQTAPTPDPHQLIQALQSEKRMHRRLQRSVFTILCGIAVLLVFEEATGRVGSHGLLSVIWILGLVSGAAWLRRAKCNRADALTLDTVALLRFLIARARSDLFVARCLYAGVPCGALAGYLLTKAAGVGTPRAAIATHPHLSFFQTAAGVATLVIMMVTGAVLSRLRRLQVQELTEKLKLLETDL